MSGSPFFGMTGLEQVITQKAVCADHLPSASHVTLAPFPLSLACGEHLKEHFLPNVCPSGQSGNKKTVISHKIGKRLTIESPNKVVVYN